MDLLRIIEIDLLEWIFKLSFLFYLKSFQNLFRFGVDFDLFWLIFFIGFLGMILLWF